MSREAAAVPRVERIVHRYLHDVTFHALVANLHHGLRTGRVSERDLCDALRLAIAIRRAEQRDARDRGGR